MQPMTPTVFEVLATQYRDWHVQIFGQEHGLPVANDALTSAKVAVVDTAFGAFEVGDYVIVWDRGIVAGPVGSKVCKRLVAWVGPASKITDSLVHDVQDNVRVIWERVS